MSNVDASKRPGWWGTYAIELDKGGKWRIGPATLWVFRYAREWRVGYITAPDPLLTGVDVSVPCTETLSDAAANVWRFGFRKTAGEVELVPALADRPMVTSPETPFYIPPREEITLYVSTPLWVQIKTGRPAMVLTEAPVYRPSDTWFGPSTLEGELCYASRTSARLDPADVPLRPHRAVTAVVIRNDGKKSLFLERLKLPVQHLSLFLDRLGHLRTETVVMERLADGGAGSVKVTREQTRGVDGVLVSGPREKPEQNIMTWTLGSLFG